MIGFGARNRLLLSGLVAALAALTLRADYPGNANFRNVSSSFAAQNRTSWATNVTTMVGSARNPGTSTPIDWDSCPQRIAIAPGVDYIPGILTAAGGWPRRMVCHFVRIDLKTPNLRFTGTDRCADWGDPMPRATKSAPSARRRPTSSPATAARSRAAARRATPSSPGTTRPGRRGSLPTRTSGAPPTAPSTPTASRSRNSPPATEHTPPPPFPAA